MDALSSSSSSPPPSHHQRRSKSTTPPVFLRDFAYANNGPVLLPDPMHTAIVNIDKASAKIFAEYVEQFHSHIHYREDMPRGECHTS